MNRARIGSPEPLSRGLWVFGVLACGIAFLTSSFVLARGLASLRDASETPIKKSVAPSVLGADRAPSLVLFLDIQCPFCRKLYAELGPWEASHPKVHVVVHNFPLTSIHRDAYGAAVLYARACGKGLGPEALAYLMTHMIDHDGLEEARVKFGLSADASGPDGQAVKAGIESDVKLAKSLGISGTPTIVFVKSQKEVYQVRSLQDVDSLI